jgi:hypothetical protein
VEGGRGREGEGGGWRVEGVVLSEVVAKTSEGQGSLTQAEWTKEVGTWLRTVILKG